MEEKNSRRRVLAYWDCSACGTKGIRGDVYDCPGCGAQRGPDVTFYMREGPQEYVKKAAAGSDWYCGFCDALNKGNAKFCENCGAPREEAEGDYFSMKKGKNADQKGRRGKASDFTSEAIEARRKAEKAKENPGKTSSGKKPIRGWSWKRKIITAVLALFLIVFTLNFFKYLPHQVVFQVDEVTWTATENLEVYKTVHEGDWSIPDRGRETDHYRKIHHYRQVLDHYESVQKSRRVEDGGHYETDTSYVDNGDGTYSEETTRTWVPDYKTEYYYEDEPVYRDDPVYKTWYEYDIERWVVDETLTETGRDKKPHYADYTPKNDKERIADQETTYAMSGDQVKKRVNFLDILTSVKKTHAEYTLTKEQWTDIEAGDELRCKVQKDQLMSYKKK